MFCRVKTKIKKIEYDNYTEYSFYLCERYRENGKVKSKDILVFKQYDFILVNFSEEGLKACITIESAYRGLTIGESQLIINKANEVIKELREIMNKRKRKEEECFNNGYTYGQAKGSSVKSSMEYNSNDKKLLKKFYKVLAINFHPDKIGGTGEEMKLINKLKKEWCI